jgi:hypothetical protein
MDNSTGSEIGLQTPRPSPVGGVTSETVSGDRYAPGLITSGSKSTGASESTFESNKRRPSQQPKLTPQTKQRCYALFSACIDSLNRALDNDAATSIVLRSTSIGQFRDTMAELWQLRAAREEQFAELINMIEGLIVERRAEDVTDDELTALRTACEQMRDEPTFSDAFANDVTVELLKSGAHVFREMD